jgi:hypothetical protein
MPNFYVAEQSYRWQLMTQAKVLTSFDDFTQTANIKFQVQGLHSKFPCRKVE